MPLTNAEKKKKYFEKLMANGLYDGYKKKKAEREQKRRQNLKEGVSKIAKTQREKLLKFNREKSRERVQKHRQKKREPATTQNTNVEASSIFPYQTASALTKAVAKLKRALPSSPTKQITVAKKFFNSFDERKKHEIIQNGSKVKSTRGLSDALVFEVQQFYERDDISRISPNVKDTRYFTNPATGIKELMQIRHLMFNLNNAYDLFIREYDLENGDDSFEAKPPLKRAKFCALRPAHVKLAGSMPHNVCFCIYHSNFIQCCTAINKYLPDFPEYGPSLISLILCENPKQDCWLATCTLCNVCDKSKQTLENMMKTTDKNAEVQWFQWKKDAITKRYENSKENGTLKTLIHYFLSILTEFLKHAYIKRLQAKTFQKDSKEVMSTKNTGVAELQIDWAENFTCESQNEIQPAHFNQNTISLFTIALKYANCLHPKVIISDITHHDKDVIVPYLFRIFLDLPKTVKVVKIWSDGPWNQFKNKFIAETIKLLESKFQIKIIWNFFATSHGKGCIDGIGAVAKRKVKREIILRKATVYCASDFAKAFHNEKSKITLIEMTEKDIEKIKSDLKLPEVFAAAPAIRNISTFHQLQFLDKKIVGFPTSEEGYQYFKQK